MPAARFEGEQDRQKKDQFLGDLPDRSRLSLRVRATDPLAGPRTNLLFTMSENTRLRPVGTDANSNIPRRLSSLSALASPSAPANRPGASSPSFHCPPAVA